MITGGCNNRLRTRLRCYPFLLASPRLDYHAAKIERHGACRMPARGAVQHHVLCACCVPAVLCCVCVCAVCAVCAAPCVLCVLPLCVQLYVPCVLASLARCLGMEHTQDLYRGTVPACTSGNTPWKKDPGLSPGPIRPNISSSITDTLAVDVASQLLLFSPCHLPLQRRLVGWRHGRTYARLVLLLLPAVSSA